MENNAATAFHAVISYADLALHESYPDDGAEIDGLRQALAVVQQILTRDTRYLLAAPRVSAGYLGFGAVFVTAVVDIVQPWGTRPARVIAVPAEHAQWQLNRLMSGMCTESQTIFPSFAAALAGDVLP